MMMSWSWAGHVMMGWLCDDELGVGYNYHPKPLHTYTISLNLNINLAVTTSRKLIYAL